MENANKMAARLKQAMIQNGMTSVALATRADCHKSSISMYLQGKHIPSAKSAERLAEILNVNPAWLLGYDVPSTCEQQPEPETTVAPIVDLSDHKFIRVDNVHINLEHVITIEQIENQDVSVLLDTGRVIQGRLVDET